MSFRLWTASERTAILVQALTVFFHAMLDGYVGGKWQKSIKVTTPDGCTTITFTDGYFQVIDQYWVTPQSDYSFGTTVIIFSDLVQGAIVENAVWSMSYGGRYPKEVIPFLKRALATAYSRGKFRGGRGPGHFIEEGLTYENHSPQGLELDSIGSSFNGFKSHEEIRVTGGETLGYHDCFGGTMI